MSGVHGGDSLDRISLNFKDEVAALQGSERAAAYGPVW